MSILVWNQALKNNSEGKEYYYSGLGLYHAVATTYILQAWDGHQLPSNGLVEGMWPVYCYIHNYEIKRGYTLQICNYPWVIFN